MGSQLQIACPLYRISWRGFSDAAMGRKVPGETKLPGYAAETDAWNAACHVLRDVGGWNRPGSDGRIPQEGATAVHVRLEGTVCFIPLLQIFNRHPRLGCWQRDWYAPLVDSSDGITVKALTLWHPSHVLDGGVAQLLTLEEAAGLLQGNGCGYAQHYLQTGPHGR